MNIASAAIAVPTRESAIGSGTQAGAISAAKPALPKSRNVNSSILQIKAIRLLV
jgi:hypothetical protein